MTRGRPLFSRRDLQNPGTVLYYRTICYGKTPFIQENIMGQQLNKIIKRRRRKAYLERVKEKVRATIAAKSKKK